MCKFKLLYLSMTCLIMVMGISSGWASEQQEYGDRQVGNESASYYDGSFMEVGRRGRRNTALAVGAIVLGTMLYNQSRQRNYQQNYSNNAHLNWCYSRYRSYRAYDNTFQPYYGPRRQCVSPYY